MTLLKFKKRDPGAFFERMFNDDFIDEILHRPLAALNVGHFGKLNVVENELDYTIEVSLPGAGKDDVDIEIVDCCMTIQSKTSEEIKDEGKNYVRQEFSHQHFKRSFTLPDDIKDGAVDAEFKDGILYIKLEKEAVVEAPKPEVKKIEIK